MPVTRARLFEVVCTSLEKPWRVGNFFIRIEEGKEITEEKIQEALNNFLCDGGVHVKVNHVYTLKEIEGNHYVFTK